MIEMIKGGIEIGRQKILVRIQEVGKIEKGFWSMEMEVMKMLIMDGRESNERKDEENIKIED